MDRKEAIKYLSDAIQIETDYIKTQADFLSGLSVPQQIRKLPHIKEVSRRRVALTTQSIFTSEIAAIYTKLLTRYDHFELALPSEANEEWIRIGTDKETSVPKKRWISTELPMTIMDKRVKEILLSIGEASDCFTIEAGYCYIPISNKHLRISHLNEGAGVLVEYKDREEEFLRAIYKAKNVGATIIIFTLTSHALVLVPKNTYIYKENILRYQYGQLPRQYMYFATNNASDKFFKKRHG